MLSIQSGGFGQRPFGIDYSAYQNQLNILKKEIAAIELDYKVQKSMEDSLSKLNGPDIATQIIPALTQIQTNAPGFYSSILSAMDPSASTSDTPSVSSVVNRSLNSSILNVKNQLPAEILGKFPQLKALSADNLSRYSMTEDEALLAVLMNYLDSGITNLDELSVISAILGMIGEKIPEDLYLKIIEMLHTFIDNLPIHSMEPKQALVLITELNGMLGSTGVQADESMVSSLSESEGSVQSDPFSQISESTDAVEEETPPVESHPEELEKPEEDEQRLALVHAYYELKKEKNTETVTDSDAQDPLSVTSLQVSQSNASDDKQDDSGSESDSSQTRSVEEGSDSAVETDSDDTQPTQSTPQPTPLNPQFLNRSFMQTLAAAGVASGTVSDPDRRRKVERSAGATDSSSKSKSKAAIERTLMALIEKQVGQLIDKVLEGVQDRIAELAESSMDKMGQLLGSDPVG